MRKKVLGLVAGLGLSVLASGVSFAYWTDHLKVNVDVPIFYQADISIKATENTATVESSATTEGAQTGDSSGESAVTAEASIESGSEDGATEKSEVKTEAKAEVDSGAESAQEVNE